VNYPPTLVRPRERPDRLIVVMSDIEMGGGGPTDDFPHSAWLGEIIRSYADVRYEPYAVDLVFNGDTFDMLKTDLGGEHPRHITEKIAVAKMRKVAQAHPAFFDAVRYFLARTGPRGNVYFLFGNHDHELVFPEVQKLIKELGGDRVRFPGWELDIGRTHIEHGSQRDPIFVVDEKKPTVDHKGEQILALSWGTVSLLDVAMPLKQLLYHHDRLKPKKLLFERMPEVKQLMTSSFWAYWTGGYFREFFADPMKTISWTMLKEVVYRLVSWDTEVYTAGAFQKMLVEREDVDLYVFGHEHEPGIWSHGLRRAIRTGAFRDEYMLSSRDEVLRPINKTYAEIFMAGADVVRSGIVELVAPLRAAGSMPHSIYDVLPEVRRRLASPELRKSQESAQKAQELKEAAEAKKLGR
jgi:UDP-2,3-diacylglucosamine pyrophosphatase LpxH